MRDESAAGYSCECEAGYEKEIDSARRVTHCVDIDECAQGEDKCDEDAKCVNVDGAYYCVCLEGFKGNGKQCESKKNMKKRRTQNLKSQT